MQTTTIPSNTTVGRTYVLTRRDGKPVACSCPGFAYRDTCRHVTHYADADGLVRTFEVFCYAHDIGDGHTLLRGLSNSAAWAWAKERNRVCPVCRDRLHVYVENTAVLA